MEEKRDPYKHKERWIEWKAQIQANGGIPDICKANSDIILAYLTDMESGINLGKGCPKTRRKPSRLNDLKGKMTFFAKLFEQKFSTEIT